MTFTFKQHIPNFIDTDRPEPCTYETVDELFENEFIKSWSDDDEFEFFAKSRNHLMAMMNNGNYWVLGTVKPISILENLPNFEDCWQYTVKEPERQAAKIKHEEESREYIKNLKNSLPPTRQSGDEICQGFASMVNNLRTERV